MMIARSISNRSFRAAHQQRSTDDNADKQKMIDKLNADMKGKKGEKKKY